MLPYVPFAKLFPPPLFSAVHTATHVVHHVCGCVKCVEGDHGGVRRDERRYHQLRSMNPKTQRVACANK